MLSTSQYFTRCLQRLLMCRFPELARSDIGNHACLLCGHAVGLVRVH